ncbi:MAG TPA: response regulator transcription factor [Thermoanaerobaculia bacterium]|nr:response regulator transcription factor [Thermoanaerobaculia bacterium]HUM28609.1 response regulator transcription factor [Thermoanaerobaculia bacterium]HXK66783.1 response regulator transcription factor [Thermoanaerobaculia bacterium]
MISGPEGPARLFVVDDHPIVRQEIQILLEQEGIQVCGEAGDAMTACHDIPRCAPDLVIVDLSLGRESGLTLLKQLRNLGYAMPLLVYSVHDDPFHITQAFRSGASGYVTKREVAGLLTSAIRELLAGRPYASPHVAHVMEREASGWSMPGTAHSP